MQDISRQIGIALRWLPLVLVLAIVAGAVAYTYASSRPVQVEATGTLRVDPGRTPSVQDRAEAVLAAVGYAAQMQSPPFARAVINELGLDEQPRDLLERVSIDADADAVLGVIEIAVRSTDPLEAQAIATAFGNELVAAKADELITADVVKATQQVRRLETDLQVLGRRQVNLRNKGNRRTEQDNIDLANLPHERAALLTAIVSLQPYTRPYVRNVPSWVVRPRVPTDPVTSGPLYWALLAAVAAGMAAMGLAFTVHYARRLNRVSDLRDLEFATGVPALGPVPTGRQDAKRPDAERLAMLHDPKGETADAYRGVIAKMGFAGGTVRSLAVVSAKPSDAKSLVAANVALAYAEAGRNVIIVDADYRTPRMHSFFGVDNARGLTTILTDSNVPLGFATVPTPHPRLGLMPAGPQPREASEPLGSRQLNALVRRLLQAADLVVFNSPAMDGSIDASVLAEQLDGVILVVPQDSKRDETEDAAHSLGLADAEFVGAVLCRKVRRTRKGPRAKVVPAPAGWGPTWPGLFHPPAQIPATAESERPVYGAGSSLLRAVAPAPQAMLATPQGNGHAAAGTPSAAGPYSVPFQVEGGVQARPEPSVAPGTTQAQVQATPAPQAGPTSLAPAPDPGQARPAPAPAPAGAAQAPNPAAVQPVQQQTQPSPPRPMQAVGPGATQRRDGSAVSDATTVSASPTSAGIAQGPLPVSPGTTTTTSTSPSR